jgi:hypothetical protein
VVEHRHEASVAAGPIHGACGSPAVASPMAAPPPLPHGTSRPYVRPL